MFGCSLQVTSVRSSSGVTTCFTSVELKTRTRKGRWRIEESTVNITSRFKNILINNLTHTFCFVHLWRWHRATERLVGTEHLAPHCKTKFICDAARILSPFEICYFPILHTQELQIWPVVMFCSLCDTLPFIQFIKFWKRRTLLDCNDLYIHY